MNLDTGLIAVSLGGIRDCISVDRTILKLDAVGDTLHVLLGDILVGPYVIDFFLHEFRVGELRCEISVVCEKKYACSVAVKTSYGIDAFFASTLHEIHDSETAVGIVACGHTVLRLVEKDVALAFESHNLVVVFDDIVV